MMVSAGTDPTQLSLGDRVELLRAWERAASWVAAQALAAVDSLQAPDCGPDPTPAVLHVPDWTREELACAFTAVRDRGAAPDRPCR